MGKCTNLLCSYKWTNRNKVSQVQLYPGAKVNVSLTGSVNLESLSPPSQSWPYQQTQTPGVGRSSQRYLEINTNLTAPIAMEIPAGGEANEIPDNGGEQSAGKCHQFLFYERLMYSRASVWAPRYCRRSLTPLTQTHLMTHAIEQEEERSKRCW